ncbi:AMMECR1 domain protein [Denitrovibrio acetiphilus DSM 12809]|jgi:hypothetical protein|uniref:AMMECR1 domain protein n=1 Tax=Denitrovibrio acetiphilus (strain DSM 12809 / NBRC 114555 / N2460) TaxID=522772 RepID=D4H1J8_DENA2|nr:AmmeMemoRadiSam system protein A [Denitrovibrio acetiphilus]ADD68758.1 AMMECR1 domain protein [Denitrovibrio acetiphilus DSM 12809]
MKFEIGREARALLLKTARESIRSYQQGAAYEPEEIPKELNFESGCFVSLNIRGRLRGCIGNFRSDLNIVKNVSEMACKAAFADPRFGPLSVDELCICNIEISILSPMVKASAEEITVGRDGIYILKGLSRGVLLPQVAVENGWDRETFLNQTCVKAGLPEDAWKEADTEILSFEALVFNENNLI